MRRGHIYTIEGMGLFVAWMIILLLTWQRSAEWGNHVRVYSTIQHEQELIQITDTLLQHHHLDPTRGCATFSSEKRREQPYVVSETCLQQLNNRPLDPLIQFIRIQTPTSEWVAYGREVENEPCTIIRRPFLLNGNTPSIMEVASCA